MFCIFYFLYPNLLPSLIILCVCGGGRGCKIQKLVLCYVHNPNNYLKQIRSTHFQLFCSNWEEICFSTGSLIAAEATPNFLLIRNLAIPNITDLQTFAYISRSWDQTGWIYPFFSQQPKSAVPSSELLILSER